MSFVPRKGIAKLARGMTTSFKTLAKDVKGLDASPRRERSQPNGHFYAEEPEYEYDPEGADI